MVITESVFRLYKIRATAQGTGTDSEVHSKGSGKKRATKPSSRDSVAHTGPLGHLRGEQELLKGSGLGR